MKNEKNKQYGVRVVFGVGSFLIAFIPTWIWLLIYHFTNPEGFWEKFVLIGVGVWIGGFVQALLFILWLIFLYEVVLKD